MPLESKIVIKSKNSFNIKFKIILLVIIFANFSGIVLAYDNNTISHSKNYVEGEVIVKYRNNKINLKDNLGQIKSLNFIKNKSLRKREDIKNINTSIFNITDGTTVESKIAELQSDPNVESAQPNYQYYSTAISTNDTYRDNLWGLDNVGQIVNGTTGTNNADINAPQAWSINEGTNNSVIVAIIDSGVAYNHPDLISNMWDGSNCKDENGTYIIGGCNHGYDYESNDITPLPDISQPSFYHGTHIAGIIAAVKNNNKGVIGVAPNAKIMAIKSSLTTSNIIKGINFAQQNGAKIINASWGSNYYDNALRNGMISFPGLFIVAAGNCGDVSSYSSNGCTSQNQTFYPAAFDLDNIISVAATDQNDNLASFSNYSSSFIDIGAPGVNILSTVTSSGDGSDEKYGYINGTSMATSYVAGLAALIEGYKQGLTDAQVKNIILTTGDSLSSLSGKTVSGKRIDAQKALESITPIKKITNFYFISPSVNGVINENNHTIIINVPFGTDVTNLSPTIVIDGASINPDTLISQDFTNPINYTVTALDNSTQIYTVTVNINLSDAMIVASDKLLLINDSIKGSNPDLSNITTPLTNPLPSSGSNGSTITWISSNPSVISNDGQTITRPAFGDGNATINLTATITKGEVIDTKIFTLIVLADTIAPTLNSITITVPATKLSYKVGESLDITGLVVSGMYSDVRTRIEIITNQNITGFNSSSPSTNQVLTVTINNKTTTFTVNIIAQSSGGGGGGGSSYTAPIPIVNAIRYLFKDQANKDIEYIDSITKNKSNISNICLTDYQSSNNLLALDTECKINVGNDLIVWTKYSIKNINNLKIVEIVNLVKNEIKYSLLNPISNFIFTTTLHLGSKNNETKELQKILIDNGYLTGIADGTFGKETLTAVKKFQQINNLLVDGVIGPKARAILNKNNNELQPIALSTVYSCLSGESFSSITGLPCTVYKADSSIKIKSILKIGFNGSETKELQKILIKKGFLIGIDDGIFGRGTLMAVKNFQLANGLTSDGVVGPITVLALEKI